MLKILRLIAFEFLNILFFVYCQNAPKMPTKIKVTAVSSKADGTNKELALDTPTDLISASSLEENEFIIKFSGVTSGDFAGYKVPVVNWNMPEKADYVEIIRCNGNVNLTGSKGNSLQNLAGQSSASAADFLRSNDFWSAAETASKIPGGGCLLLTPKDEAKGYEGGFTGNSYLDISANSEPINGIVYIIRACISSQRLADAEIFGSRNCSKLVGYSGTPYIYQSSKANRDKNIESEAQNLRSYMDGLVRKIYFLTAELNKSLENCSNAKIDLSEQTQVKETFSKILGNGISLAGNAASSTNMSTGDTLAENINFLTATAKEFESSCTDLQSNSAKLNMAKTEYVGIRAQWLEKMKRLDPNLGQGTAK